MKTYTIVGVLCALIIVSCSKSENTTTSEGESENSTLVLSDYALLLNKDGIVTTQVLGANADTVLLTTKTTNLKKQAIPNLSILKGANFLQYHKTNNCTGVITSHDFSTDVTNEWVVFENLSACDFVVTAIAQQNNALYVSYVVTNENTNTYMLRVFDTQSTDVDFVEISLSKKPKDLVVAGDKLFILTLDELVSDENSLFVMDLQTNTITFEIQLGYDAERIFTNAHNELVISYDELHATLNLSTLVISYIRYTDGTNPNFVNAKSNHFDAAGKMYYAAVSPSNSIYSKIPAVHDFSSNLTTLYAFENFLTEAKRTVQFQIETATAVGFDEENGLILIGYKKIGVNKGGLLRIKPAPELTFIDNIDVDGIPFEIIDN